MGFKGGYGAQPSPALTPAATEAQRAGQTSHAQDECKIIQVGCQNSR